ncbi:MAG: hypothetical protein RLZ98_1379 [Pseudomonadota bacterium]|jgi:23S rRNA (cytosine1962-C5)-methyltransferase
MDNDEQPRLVVTHGFTGYELLDSGGGRKLERIGGVIVDRPEAQAIWQRSLDGATWAGAQAVFAGSKDDEDGESSERGRWKLNGKLPETWPVVIPAEGCGDVTILGRLMSFRHLGLFPEQVAHWDWMRDRLAESTGNGPREKPRVLNLFAYTGAASLIAAAAGADVVHVDASKRAITWARENQAASGLGDASIRWIVEDARKFVAREVRRGRTYDVILVDPPKFGRGPGGEVWDLFADLPPLLADCAKLIGPGRSALVLTVYAIRASSLAFRQLAGECMAGRGGVFEYGELAIAPRAGGNAVPTSLFVRWSST